MPDPNIIVGLIRSLSPQVGNFSLEPQGTPRSRVEIGFADRAAWLNPESEMFSSYADALEELHQANLPVYVEVDPHTGVVRRVEVPFEGPVVYLATSFDGNIGFALRGSACRFSLRRSNSGYAEFVQVLRESGDRGVPVFLTVNESGSAILDIRLNTEAPERPPELAERENVVEIGEVRPVTLHQAQRLFGMVRERSCNPAVCAPPCIPFLYPFDGCEARAGEMCRLIASWAIQPGKYWNFGSLTVNTPNEPLCEAYWHYHVAPFLQVETPGTPGAEPYIVDPSLFPHVVPAGEWLAVQGVSNKSLMTSAAPYSPRDPFGQTGFDYDSDYKKTNAGLARSRKALRLRCRAAHGAPPPPYLNCLFKKVGAGI